MNATGESVGKERVVVVDLLKPLVLLFPSGEPAQETIGPGKVELVVSGRGKQSWLHLPEKMAGIRADVLGLFFSTRIATANGRLPKKRWQMNPIVRRRMHFLKVRKQGGGEA